jgi:hypothetical protein
MLADDILFGLDVIMHSAEIRRLYASTYPRFRQQLMSATRFNLSENVVQAIGSLVATKSTNIKEYLDFARRPTRIDWIEFPVKPRIDFLHRVGLTPQGQQPARVGFLIDDNPDFPGDQLCGRAVVGWRHYGSEIGETAYAQLVWNFRSDWVDTRSAQEKAEFAKRIINPQNVAWLHKNDPREVEAHAEINARFSLSHTWLHHDFLVQQFAVLSSGQIAKLITGADSDASSEASTILAVLIMMNLTRALQYKDVSYGKLNKAREKRGKPPLMDHKDVSFYLSKAKRQSYTKRGMTVEQGVVLQRVVGHVRSRYSARRKTRELFWVEPYQRGAAEIGLGPSITKTKTVKL